MEPLMDYAQLKKLIKKNKSLFKELRKDSVPKPFKKWLAQNEHIFWAFHEVALELKRNGRRDKYGAKAISEHLRWQTLFMEEDSQFKIDHNYASYMSRLSTLVSPELKGMFYRKITNKDHPNYGKKVEEREQ